MQESMSGATGNLCWDHFLILGCAMGTLLGALGVLQGAYLDRWYETRSAEFFGFFGFFGKVAALIGPPSTDS